MEKLSIISTDEKFDLTGVFEGLGDSGGVDAAKSWLSQKIKEFAGVESIDVYSKGDYKGMFFVKFASKVSRDMSIKKF